MYSVPPVHHVLCLTQPDALTAWRLLKPEAIPMLPNPLGALAAQYYEAVRIHYDGGEQVSTGLAVLRQGHAFLRSAKAWYEGNMTR